MGKSTKPIVVSGIRSTGHLHLGNYLGALRNFVAMQETYQCYFFIADLHSLTTHPTPDHLQDSVRDILAEYLAAGLDIEQCALYVQSDIQETIELYLYLNMNAYLGELERCTSFKEKVRQNPNNVNAGLLTYPTLMAADILIHRADLVPVGKDQEQHLEMARTFAERFNRLYQTDLFTSPQAYQSDKPLVKIPGLDGNGKMGKSEGNAIYLADTPDQIRKKVMKAVSDIGPSTIGQPKSEPVQNLFTIMEQVSSHDTLAHFEDLYNRCEIRYGDMKKQLAEDLVIFLAPLREKIEMYRNDERYLRDVARIGAEKAHVSATETLKRVREVVGIRSLF